MKKKYILPAAIIAIITLMSSVIDLNNLINYKYQAPVYITKDNTPNDNSITDKGATLGRILFYDKNLSVDNSTACASCHIQEFAFSDTARVSVGMNGVTGRHSMRLVNAQFSDEVNFFWDERAFSLEDQTTKPIQDHVEMGFSGSSGDPDLDSLIRKLDNIDYYGDLFELVYGNKEITEDKIQKALAQFVRSIHSFDSKYDSGRVQVSNSSLDFPNFTLQENEGKNLFMSMPPMGGAGCARCHSGDEFSINPNINNNGVIGVVSDLNVIDLTNTKAPTLRDLVNKNGTPNGPFMHDGSLKTLMDVVNHYNDLNDTSSINTNLDFRLAGSMHDLNLTIAQKDALVAFLNTLSGNDVYTNPKWSDPFDSNGNITVIPNNSLGVKYQKNLSFQIYPNIVSNNLNITIENGNYNLSIYNLDGKVVWNSIISGNKSIDVNTLSKGLYLINIQDINSNRTHTQRIIKK